MKVLGISGGPHRRGEDPVFFPRLDGYWHDAAAAIIEDGEILVAHEEERIARVKHTANFPELSINACLAGVSFDQVEAVAIYFTEDYWRRFLAERSLLDPNSPNESPRQLLSTLVEGAAGVPVNSSLLRFISHHTCHAMAAWRGSGFDNCLVLTLDGAGDSESGMLGVIEDGIIRVERTFPIANSLGGLYLWVTRYLGFSQFDEYKVMGLAAYGNPHVLTESLGIISLKSSGQYAIDWAFIHRLETLAGPRRRGETFSQFHADLAAAVQHTLEETVLHILRFARKATGRERLCFSGGVAHNCLLNARIAETEQFQEIFVHPASNDAGCAIGAAFAVEMQEVVKPTTKRLTHVFLGTTITPFQITEASRLWSGLVTIRERTDILNWTAERLANGYVLGWVQGRSEFGPRALGHRSILADPRDAAIKERLNALIKCREGFRPFAPIVQIERARDFFEIPLCADCSFMSFAVPVKREWRTQLAAITHVDGTARVQTVSKAQDEMMWTLLNRFEGHVGIPVLLNTSFNVASEPIVDSIDDAIICVLSTQIDAAIVNHFVIAKDPNCDLDALGFCIADDVRVLYKPATRGANRVWTLERGGPDRSSTNISQHLLNALLATDCISLQQILALLPSAIHVETKETVLQLWARRFIRCKARATYSAHE